MTVLFNILMRQTLTDYFGGLNKNTNCAFPLMNGKASTSDAAALPSFADLEMFF